MSKIDEAQKGNSTAQEIADPSVAWEAAMERARQEMDMSLVTNGFHLPSLDMNGQCHVDGEVLRTPATASEKLEETAVRINHATIRYHVRRRIKNGADISVIQGLNRVGKVTTLYPEEALMDGVGHLRNLKVQVGEDGTYLSRRGFTYMSIPALAAKHGIPESTLRNHFMGEDGIQSKTKTIPARDVKGRKIILYRLEDIKPDLEQIQESSKIEATLDKDEYCEIERVRYCSMNGCLNHMLKDAKHKPTRKCLEVRIIKEKLPSKKAKTLGGDSVNVYTVTDLERIIKVYFEEARVEKKGEKRGIYTDPEGQEYASMQTWLARFGVGEKAFESGFEEKFKSVWPEGSKIEGVDLGGNKSSLYLKATVEESLAYILKAEAIIHEGICTIQQQVREAADEATQDFPETQLPPGKIYKSDRKLEADHGDQLEIGRCEIRRRMLRASTIDPSAKITIQAKDRKKGTDVTVFDVDYALEKFGKK